MSDTDDFFAKTGLGVEAVDLDAIEIGGVYPLYGMITEILDGTFENLSVRLNSGITLTCVLLSEKSVETIKARAFEPGIFITKITSVDPIEGQCTTIVFGRRQTQEV